MAFQGDIIYWLSPSPIEELSFPQFSEQSMNLVKYSWGGPGSSYYPNYSVHWIENTTLLNQSMKICLCAMAHAHNPSTQEAEVWGSQIWSQPRWFSKTLSRNENFKGAGAIAHWWNPGPRAELDISCWTFFLNWAPLVVNTSRPVAVSLGFTPLSVHLTSAAVCEPWLVHHEESQAVSSAAMGQLGFSSAILLKQQQKFSL